MDNDLEFQPSALESIIPASADSELPAAQPEPIVQPDTEPPSSDETGVNNDETASPAVAEPTETPSTIPFAAYENERRIRQETQHELEQFRAQLAQQQQQFEQPQPEAPDAWEDPQAALNHQAQILETKFQSELQRRDQMMTQNRVEMSEMLVKQQHEDYDEVTEAFAQVAMKNEALAHQMLNHPMPAQFAYQTGKQMMALQQFGSDPDAYRAKIEAEIMAKHGWAPGQVQANPITNAAQVPTSLASVSSAPAPMAGGVEGPTPLDKIISNI